MTPGIEEPVFGQRAGGDDAHDRALYRALVAAPPRLGRVFHLVANRHLEAGADQAREIGFGGVYRDAAHRDVGAVVAAALGQRDIERRRRGDRVLEEQFVEIAHPEKQQAAGMGALDLVVLQHDRRAGKRRHRLGCGFGIGLDLCRCVLRLLVPLALRMRQFL